MRLRAVFVSGGFGRCVVACAALWTVFNLAPLAWAVESWVSLPTGRADSHTPAFAITHEKALATLILLPGGDADTGSIVNDKPGSNNFLSRSREFFADQGFNVLVLYRPSDMTAMDNRYRASGAHIAELREAAHYARRQFNKPVWLVGTSKGTVSAAAAGIGLEPGLIDGVVLTATITHMKSGGVSSLAVGRLAVPVLMVHHARDQCRVCVPQDARVLATMFNSAPVKRFVMLDGGSDPSGDPCHGRHWHGFINYERETVRLITDWIKNPMP